MLVTSIGTGDSRDAPPKQVYEVLEKVLLEKAKAEDFLMVRLGLSAALSGKGLSALPVAIHVTVGIVTSRFSLYHSTS